MISKKEAESLRALATRWMEHSADPIMPEHRRQWRAIKDLKAEKPMILVKTCMLADYIGQDEIGDDIVVDSYFRIPWELEIGDYGVPIEAHHAISYDGSDLGYSFNFGVQSEADAQTDSPTGAAARACAKGSRTSKRRSPTCGPSASRVGATCTRWVGCSEKSTCTRASRPRPTSAARTPTGRWRKKTSATLTTAKDCKLELCFRDIYTIDGDRSRLARWTEMTRALMDA